jgi:hypothetical protein
MLTHMASNLAASRDLGQVPPFSHRWHLLGTTLSVVTLSALPGTLCDFFRRGVWIDLLGPKPRSFFLWQVELGSKVVDTRHAAPEVDRQLCAVHVGIAPEPAKLVVTDKQLCQCHQPSTASGMITPV